MPMGFRDILARLMGPAQPSQPLSFEELMRQSNGDRDTAAKRFNAQQGGPVSSAYSPAGAAAPGPKTPQELGALIPPIPTGTLIPPITPENTAPIPTPRPVEILEDRATRERPTPIPTPRPPVSLGPQQAIDAAPSRAPTPSPRPAVKQAKKKKRSQYRLVS